MAKLRAVDVWLTDWLTDGLMRCSVRRSWLRIVVEKPFGKDLASSEKLADDLSKHFPEEQVSTAYRAQCREVAGLEG